jgi:hypothetical protein
MTIEERASKQLTREKLLKRASVGAVLFATPVLSSTASAERLPRFVCIKNGVSLGCEVDGDPCFGQRNCTNPDERFCTCLRATGGRCFCHEPSICSDLVPCTRQADCPDDFACAASCCSGGDVNNKFCHPPCGTPATGTRVTSGWTSAGRL